MARIGTYRHWVSIKRPVEEVSPQGDSRVVGWDDVQDIWASVKPLSGRQLETARTQIATVSHEVRMRYVPGITEDMSVFCDTQGEGERQLVIGSVYSPDEGGDELVLLCSENKGIPNA